MLQSPPINTPPNFPISSHHLTLYPSHFPPISVLLFLVFVFLHFGVKRGQLGVKKCQSWGSKRPTDWGRNIVNPFGLFEYQSRSIFYLRLVSFTS